MRMRHNIMSSVACLAVAYSSTLSLRRHDFQKIIIERKTCVLIFSTTLSKIFPSLRRVERDITNVRRSPCKIAVILAGF
jgi:hypothetical protein